MKSSPLESQEDIFNNNFLSWQKQTKKENTRNREIRCRNYPGKYIAKISTTEGRFQAKVESESKSRAPRRVPGATRRGDTPGGLLGPLELLSGSTWAWNFSNFAKTLKSKILWMFAMFSYRN